MNIGVMNSGGDSPGLNAVIEGVVGAASRRGWNVVGFYDGFEGLLSEEGDERFEWLTPAACRGLRAKGGTILGTVNKGNFAIKVGVDQKGAIEPAVLEKTKATVRRLGLDALIVVGGDGSQSTALLLSEIGLPVVGVPKTIDNDLGATDVTFGFYSAVSIVSESLDRLETTANAHQRMMVVEVMGRHAGWIALEGGIAGSADVILLPEIPFSLENVVECIKARKARSCVLGHIQRGGSPCSYDRILGTRFGSYAVELVEKRQFSCMVALRGTQMTAVPIEEAVKTLKLVDPDCQLVRTARDLGVCFGD